jgi:hypothetical protein
MHNYHDVNGKFPPQAIRSKDGKPLLSWRVAILPYLEQMPLYQQFHLDEPWDSDHNKALIEKMPPTFASPAIGDALRAKGMTSYLAPLTRKPPAVFDAAAPGKPQPGGETIFDPPQGITFASISDGTSNTIMVLEGHPKSAVVWSKPDDLVIDEKKLFAALDGQPNDGFNAVLADGSVQFILAKVDPQVFWRMLLMNDGNAIQQ